jgi:hypothetical protein
VGDLAGALGWKMKRGTPSTGIIRIKLKEVRSRKWHVKRGNIFSRGIK